MCSRDRHVSEISQLYNGYVSAKCSQTSFSFLRAPSFERLQLHCQSWVFGGLRERKLHQCPHKIHCVLAARRLKSFWWCLWSEFIWVYYLLVLYMEWLPLLKSLPEVRSPMLGCGTFDSSDIMFNCLLYLCSLGSIFEGFLCSPSESNPASSSSLKLDPCLKSIKFCVWVMSWIRYSLRVLVNVSHAISLHN